MTPPIVWVNKYLSNTWEILERLVAERRPREFELICSHPWPQYPGRRVVDHFFVEPRGLTDTDYVEWCLEFAATHQVSRFIPGRKLLPIAAAAPRFAERGTTLMTAAPYPILQILVDKAATYQALVNSSCLLPDYEVVTQAHEFPIAVNRLRRRHSRVCCKPTRSIYGIGFRVLDDATEWKRATGSSTTRSPSLETSLSASNPTMVMEFLPGPERSVDCLAHQGQLVCCVIRRKDLGVQWIERHPFIESLLPDLTTRFQLTGMFNVQFADARGLPHLLEINPRMSGGLPISHQAGVNFLLWAIRLSSGTAHPDDVPSPKTDICVHQPEPGWHVSR